MSSSPFIHLHTHSDFSMLQASTKVSKLIARAKELEMPALALTDYNSMCGWVEFYKGATKAGIKPIIGCHFHVATGSRTDISPYQNNPRGYSIVLLAKNFEGYQSLCRLNAIGHLEGKYQGFPRIDKEALAQHNQSVVAMSAYENSEIFELLKAGKKDQAIEVLNFFKDLYGQEDFYLSLENHGLDHEIELLPQFAAIAEETNTQIVASNHIHYLEKDDAPAHDVLLSIGEKRTVHETDRTKFGSDNYHFRTQEEMQKIFADYPQALENTWKIAEKCDCHLDFKTEHYPVYDCGIPDGQPEYLRQVCYNKLPSHYKFTYTEGMELTEEQKVIMERIEFELGVIIRTGYASYFLVVWDFINWSRENDIPVGPGRGSGAGSIIAYLTGITNLDPIKYDLLFERFLNPERISPPDFDIDFCERRRHEVINYVRDKYGADKVAQIGTYGTLKAKAVFKDVTRALGYNHTQADRITKMLPNHPKLTLGKALDPGSTKSPNELFSPDFKAAFDNEPWVQDVMQHAFKLEGLNRQMGIHAAGVIIGDQTLTNLVPLSEGQNQGDSVTQFAGPPCEDLGLLKMDFLGLRTLTVIDDAVKMIKRYRDIDIEIEEIPLDDAATYKLFQDGRTVAVFQYESAGMQKWMKLLKPTVFGDLIAMNALYRPGPMDYIPSFIARKHGEEPIEYGIPDMAEYLDETYGINVYQEQVMLLSQKIGGFTKGEADTLRKAMGKKKKDVLDELKPKFINQAVAKGYPQDVLEDTWVAWEAFASYAFNKSHSTCYAWVAYQTAFLKAHYAPEFIAATLNSELGNTDKLTFFIAECRNAEIPVLPPCINHSEVKFSIEDGAVRFGLSAIKGGGTAAAECIMRAREEGGPFKNFLDFCERIDSSVNKRMIEALIKSGGFDCFGEKRSALFQVIEVALQRAQTTVSDREAGQMNFFDSFATDDNDSEDTLDMPNIPEWHERERLEMEKTLLGFYASGHPLGELTEIIDTFSSHSIIGMQQNNDEMGVKFGGMINTVMLKTSRKDNSPWAILAIEDENSSIEVLCFPDTYTECAKILKEEAPVFIEGIYSHDEERGQKKVIARRIIALEEAPAWHCEEMHLRLSQEEMTKDSIDSIRKSILAFCQNFNSCDKKALINHALIPYKKDSDRRPKLERYLNDTFATIQSGAQLVETFRNPHFAELNGEQLIPPAERNGLLQWLKQFKKKSSLVVCAKTATDDMAFIEAGPAYRLAPDWQLIRDLRQVLPEDAIHFKADKTTPEVRKRYPRKG